jgi:hypothetical protein
MNPLEGLWRLVDSRSWHVGDDRLGPMPYGSNPIGQLSFSRDRMLLSVWHVAVDSALRTGAGLHSFGGPCTFDGSRLECDVVVATDPRLVGIRHGRAVVLLGDDEMLWQPPARIYGTQIERRELVWQRVWRDTQLPGGV